MLITWPQGFSFFFERIAVVAVIHKQTYLFHREAPVTQTFQVPVNARLIAIDWDPKLEQGISFWYIFRPPLNTDPDDLGEMRTWRLTRRNTGQVFSADESHLATLVRHGYSYHILNAGEFADIRWVRR